MSFLSQYSNMFVSSFMKIGEYGSVIGFLFYSAADKFIRTVVNCFGGASRFLSSHNTAPFVFCVF